MVGIGFVAVLVTVEVVTCVVVSMLIRVAVAVDTLVLVRVE